jgi:prolyl-tRNA synthetase
LKKIQDIIRQEMDMIGGMEMQTSALQEKSVWEKTNRWSDEVVDNWFKTKLKNGTELGLSFTNEEAFSSLMKNFVSSYKDLPAYPYDFKTIFRNEVRAKSGVMRGREFYWKALYSFSRSEQEHDAFYDVVKKSYISIYNRVGLGEKTYLTFAAGGTFSKYSHEFQTVSSSGEDTIYIDRERGVAINEEVLTDEVLSDLDISRDSLVEEKAIEVGNIFSLGFKFSEPFDLVYTNEDGQNIPVYMGSYGIGITRLMGTIVEVLSDDKGIVWPESVAPFQVHIISLGKNDEAEDMYKKLTAHGVEVLFDDRDATAGAKLADADLIGIPHRVVVSVKSLEAGGFEYKKRNEEHSEIIDLENLLKKIQQ